MKVSLGNLTDQLSIVNIKIFFAEDLKRDPAATDSQIADATRKTNILNSLRNDLIQAIDEGLNEIAAGKHQKLYKQGFSKTYGKK